jgi:predicted transglutaminase-like cysteine proteinase
MSIGCFSVKTKNKHLVPVTLLLILLFYSHALAGSGDGLFGSHETRYETFTLFPKWVGALSRHKKDDIAANLPCESPMQTSCIFLQWRTFLNTLKNKSAIQQLNAVNRNMNKHQYITDITNWGMTDYWATTKEFSIKDGDCEDFAIAKFKSLLYLGIPNDNMRIVVLHDLNLRVAHAVLAVYVNGKAYILDNQAEQVIPAEKIKHYIPIYSINETNWWRHS